MIEKNRDISIQDNFLEEKEFNALRDVVTTGTFPWFYFPTTVDEQTMYERGEDKESSSGLLTHSVYHNDIPTSELFQQLFYTFEQLQISVLIRVKLNLQMRALEPEFATFHSDMDRYLKSFQQICTTSILYINTCNGYTEIEDGTKVDSVANRLVSFPSNMEHRGISQTDEKTRILVNFNYLKGPG